MAGMADEEDSRRFVIVSDSDDYFGHDDALSHPPYNCAILFLAKLRVIYALQRVWRLKVNSSITGKAVINDKFTVTSDIKCKQLESLCFLHETLLGIRTVFNAGVYSLMQVVYNQSNVLGSSTILVCPLVCQEISLCCVQVTHFLSGFSSVSFHQATQILPLPLDEQLTTICHEWLPLVAYYLESITYTLSNLNLHCNPVDDVSQIFHAVYLEASSIDNFMKIILDSLDRIIETFKV